MTLNELVLVIPEPSVTLASVPINVTHTGLGQWLSFSISGNLQDLNLSYKHEHN